MRFAFSLLLVAAVLVAAVNPAAALEVRCGTEVSRVEVIALLPPEKGKSLPRPMEIGAEAQITLPKERCALGEMLVRMGLGPMRPDLVLVQWYGDPPLAPGENGAMAPRRWRNIATNPLLLAEHPSMIARVWVPWDEALRKLLGERAA